MPVCGQAAHALRSVLVPKLHVGTRDYPPHPHRGIRLLMPSQRANRAWRNGLMLARSANTQEMPCVSPEIASKFALRHRASTTPKIAGPTPGRRRRGRRRTRERDARAGLLFAVCPPSRRPPSPRPAMAVRRAACAPTPAACGPRRLPVRQPPQQAQRPGPLELPGGVGRLGDHVPTSPSDNVPPSIASSRNSRSCLHAVVRVQGRLDGESLQAQWTGRPSLTQLVGRLSRLAVDVYVLARPRRLLEEEGADLPRGVHAHRHRGPRPPQLGAGGTGRRGVPTPGPESAPSGERHRRGVDYVRELGYRVHRSPPDFHRGRSYWRRKRPSGPPTASGPPGRAERLVPAPPPPASRPRSRSR